MTGPGEGEDEMWPGPTYDEPEEKFTFFWEGPFSQWHKSDFILHGIKFNCAEKYMMWRKATLFKDDKIAEAILKSNDPKQIKALGRQVANFDEALWKIHAKDFVLVGSLAKYSQNEKMLNELLKTEGTTLVEASPYDKIWGIGLLANDPRVLDRRTWQGTNWLGEVLTLTREMLSSSKKLNAPHGRLH